MEYDEDSEKFIIKAQAICFPILLQEIIKGLYEIISLEGFTSDPEKNKNIVNLSKFIYLKNKEEIV